MVGFAGIDLERRLRGGQVCRAITFLRLSSVATDVVVSALPAMCLSSTSGISFRTRASKSSFRTLCSNARVQCAMMCSISATKASSVVIFPYQLCTNSFRMMARKA